MSQLAILRDYSLTGADGRRALERGLANATWYRAPIPRARLKELMQRSDGPALRDTLIWIAAFAVTGGLGAWLWLQGSWWAIPCLIAYGVLYGSSSDSRWHEAGHGTAFRTPWLNDAVYHVACFMVLREPTVWRWSHARHHTDTLIVGRDPEIALMRPIVVLRAILLFLAVPQVIATTKSLTHHALGRLSPDEATLIPESERPKVYRTARIWLAIHALVIGLAIWLGSWLPVLLVGPLPSMYGGWLHVIFGFTQHGGLAEDVLDHRLNSRSVLMNPVFRFLYWNMNYHVEHHMFPMVPYHRLPELHEALKPYCPPPAQSLVAAYREIIPALWRQVRDPGYYIRRSLPEAAQTAAAE
ncbi:MAG: fatty acid desaturase family protein [Hyphomicrobiaceae bacterium]